MKPRKKPTQRMRALLQKEIESQCPFCLSKEVDTFEVHHIDETPDNNAFENLIMVCPTCHAKINVGTIPRNDVYCKKFSLMEAQKQKCKQKTEKSSAARITMKDVEVGIIGNNNIVNKQTVKKHVIKYPPDCIGGDSVKANYIAYLIKRYNEFARWKRDNFKYPAFNAHLKKKFKISPQRSVYNIPMIKFDELVEYIQQRISNTQLGRIKQKSQRLFDTFTEYCAKTI